ncbi:MAG: hypothetical protein K2J15_03810 [Muribaculaceae bacterium]|nr:hypothetical protein [Muribaculaceae bacterium]
MRKSNYGPTVLLTCGILTGLTLPGCSSAGSEKNDSVPVVTSEEYHADNDIAMNLRSIIDAINVGQSLDSTDYNFKGILTDGSGRPLYTDVQGTPGQWEIKVLSGESAVISNLYLGDLLADDLVTYLLSSLGIYHYQLMTMSAGNDDTDDSVSIYTTGDSELIIEQRTAKAPNGAEGPLLKITVRKTKL